MLRSREQHEPPRNAPKISLSPQILYKPELHPTSTHSIISIQFNRLSLPTTVQPSSSLTNLTYPVRTPKLKNTSPRLTDFNFYQRLDRERTIRLAGLALVCIAGGAFGDAGVEALEEGGCRGRGRGEGEKEDFEEEGEEHCWFGFWRTVW